MLCHRASLLLLLLTATAAGCAPRHAETAAGALQAEGARLYGDYCALCHGERGEGYVADNANALTNQDFLVSVTDAFLRRAIENGRPGTPMAPYAERLGGPLSDHEVDAIVAFLRSFQHRADASLRQGTVSGDPTRALPIFAERCASCHGDHGQGVTAISLANPEFLEHASDGQIRYAIAHGREGTPMPAFAGELPDARIDDLVALLRSWQSESPVPQAATAGASGEVVLNPDGPAAHFELRDGRYVPAAQLRRELARGARMVLLDARPISNWLEAHIPGAIPAPYYDIASVIDRLPRDGTWIVAYCACPHAASGRVKDALEAAGFPHTAVLDEGVLWWKREGLPMEAGPRLPEGL